jgi:hypothetical protein
MAIIRSAAIRTVALLHTQCHKRRNIDCYSESFVFESTRTIVSAIPRTTHILAILYERTSGVDCEFTGWSKCYFTWCCTQITLCLLVTSVFVTHIVFRLVACVFSLIVTHITLYFVFSLVVTHVLCFVFSCCYSHYIVLRLELTCRYHWVSGMLA